MHVLLLLAGGLVLVDATIVTRNGGLRWVRIVARWLAPRLSTVGLSVVAAGSAFFVALALEHP